MMFMKKILIILIIVLTIKEKNTIFNEHEILKKSIYTKQYTLFTKNNNFINNYISYKTRKYKNIVTLKKNIEYLLYIKILLYYKKIKKKTFNFIQIKNEKRDHKYIKKSYIYFYTFLTLYPTSKYKNNIIKKQKILYNKLTLMLYTHTNEAKLENKIKLIETRINIIKNYKNSKVIKKIIYQLEKKNY